MFQLLFNNIKQYVILVCEVGKKKGRQLSDGPEAAGKVRSSERREQDAALLRRKRQIFVPFRQAARRPDGANTAGRVEFQSGRLKSILTERNAGRKACPLHPDRG